MDEHEQLKQRIMAYMHEHNTLTLSTYAEGTTWAASVFFVNDDLNIYFLSDPKTRHGRNILANPHVAATINEDYRDWRKIKGIQLEGRANLVNGRREKAKAMAAYVRKFPFVTDFFSSSGGFSLSMLTRITSTTFFKLQPSRLLLLDNEKGFGHREELILS